MARESKANKALRAQAVYRELALRYGNIACPLQFDNDPFRLTIATLLSAQTTDKNVNKVTPVLWQHYPTIADLAGACQSDERLRERALNHSFILFTSNLIQL